MDLIVVYFLFLVNNGNKVLPSSTIFQYHLDSEFPRLDNYTEPYRDPGLSLAYPFK